MTTALDSFRTQLHDVYGADDKVAIERGPSEMDVPGFTTYQAVVHGAQVCGWARADGAVVTMARQNFGLILDAVDFAAEPPGMAACDVVDRLVWSHGPRYELVEHVPAGELGLDADVAVPISRRRLADGIVQLYFAVREREDDAPVTIVHYTIAGSKARPFVVGQRQLAPEVADPDADEDE